MYSALVNNENNILQLIDSSYFQQPLEPQFFNHLIRDRLLIWGRLKIQIQTQF